MWYDTNFISISWTVLVWITIVWRTAWRNCNGNSVHLTTRAKSVNYCRLQKYKQFFQYCWTRGRWLRFRFLCVFSLGAITGKVSSAKWFVICRERKHTHSLCVSLLVCVLSSKYDNEVVVRFGKQPANLLRQNKAEAGVFHYIHG